MTYRATRFWENCEKRVFDGVGEYDIPQIQGIYDIEDNLEFIGWNYAKSCKNPENKCLHFFLDDYQFSRLWTNPDTYIDMLRKFKYVLSPDFSPYVDFPKAVQIFNHYRKHWLGAYWQQHGINVIPTIRCNTERYSWEFCFDGEPKNSVVAISSVGALRSKKIKEIMIETYYEMVRRLNPSCIIFYGDVPEECKGNIIRVKPFQDRFRKAVCDG